VGQHGQASPLSDFDTYHSQLFLPVYRYSHLQPDGAAGGGLRCQLGGEGRGGRRRRVEQRHEVAELAVVLDFEELLPPYRRTVPRRCAAAADRGAERELRRGVLDIDLWPKTSAAKLEKHRKPTAV
jgi:hypothetical protein